MRFSFVRAAMIAAIVGFVPVQVAQAQLYATGSSVFLKYVSSVVVRRTEAHAPEPDVILLQSRWGVNLGFQWTQQLPGNRVRTLPGGFSTVDCGSCSGWPTPAGRSFASLSEAGDVFALHATLEEWANGYYVLGGDLLEQTSRQLDYAYYSPVASTNPGGVQAFFLTELATPDGNYTHELRIAPLGFGADAPQMILRTGGLAFAPSSPAIPVPEPSTLVLLASALALLGVRGASRR